MSTLEIKFNYAKAQKPPIRFLDRVFGPNNRVLIQSNEPERIVLNRFAEQQGLNPCHLRIYLVG